MAIPQPVRSASAAAQSETHRQRQRQLSAGQENQMNKEPKSPNRIVDTPRDKPMSERTEHANHERPGAQAHPRAAGGWNRLDAAAAWRVR
jgi:hypothetical protein